MNLMQNITGNGTETTYRNQNGENHAAREQSIRFEMPGSCAQQKRIADVHTVQDQIHCFLIQAYYTPFFIKIQAFCKKTDRFVDYDKIYVNIVMLTYHILEHLFLPFSIVMTTSSVFRASESLNIVFAFFPSIPDY